MSEGIASCTLRAVSSEIWRQTWTLFSPRLETSSLRLRRSCRSARITRTIRDAREPMRAAERDVFERAAYSIRLVEKSLFGLQDEQVSELGMRSSTATPTSQSID